MEPTATSMWRSIASHATQLARFAGVGLFCFLLGFSLLAGLHELAGLHYLVAYAMAFAVTSTVGYLLNGRYTFRADDSSRAGVVRYTLVNIALLTANGAALRMLVEYFHVWYLAASILLAVINTPVSYLAHRLLTFRLGLRQVGT